MVGWGQVEVDTDGTFEEGPVCIVDSRDQVFLRKIVRLMRVLCSTVEWRSQRGSARTRCGPPIPSCLGMKVRGLVVRFKWLVTCRVEYMLHMHASDYDCSEFRDEIPFKEGRM